MALLLAWGLSPVYAQEAAVPADESPLGLPYEEAPAEEGPEEPAPVSVLELDIRTSSLTELAAWCRSLGLGEGGGKEDLANRLRDYFGLPMPGAVTAGGTEGGSGGGRTIIIESARSTEYFSLEVVGEEYVRLRGDVVISLQDGKAVHRIRAWEILYNRTRNILTASGGVEYVREEGATRETFRGEYINVDLDDWSSVFIDTVSERASAGGGAAFLFSGTVISRDADEVTILTDAEVTGGAEGEHYWSISASKIWLLPGSDWAIFNAVLKVGEIPVFYLPFLFYPADEIIFHPVLGVRTREGLFAQTTTYILGRPKASSSSESSITNILGEGSGAQVREGLFLRSTGEPVQDQSEIRLSLLLDLYSNLGAYTGIELSLPGKGIFGGMDLSFGIGLTREIYAESWGYTPYDDNGDSHWDSSYFFSLELPFRYRLETQGRLTGTYGSFSWSLPLYSDPYVNQDLMNRAGAKNWISMVMDTLTSGLGTSSTTTASAINSFEWRLSGSLNPKLEALAPYISSFSLGSISSSMGFQYTTTGGFFYPQRLTMFSLSGSLQGTLLDAGGKPAAPAQTRDVAAEEAGFRTVLGDTGLPLPPWEAEEGAGTAAGEGTGQNGLTPPPLDQKFSFTQPGLPKFSISYRLSPSGTADLLFHTAPWTSPSELDLGDISSILGTFRTDGSFNFSLTDPVNGLYSSSLRIYGSTALQGYWYLNREAAEFDTDVKWQSALRRISTASFFTLQGEWINSLKPFYGDPVWSGTTLSHTIRGLLVKSAFDEAAFLADPLAPSHWILQYADWDKTKMDAHQLSFNLAASIEDKTQSLSFTAELPPRDSSLSANMTLRFWISTTVLSGMLVKPFEEDQRFEPLSLTETLNFATGYSALVTLVFTPEYQAFTSLTSTLTLKDFKASFSAARLGSYELIENQGWQLTSGELQFRPRDFRMEYAPVFKIERLFDDPRNALSLNLNTSITLDLQRYTYSKFDFSLGITLKIDQFLDLSLSSRSENAVIFRYVQSWFNLPQIPGEPNILIDLFNSFAFWDESLRRASGFKLKSFSLNLTHYLGDWTAALTITVSPYLDRTQNPYRYKFNPKISFSVKWTPISEIKLEGSYDETRTQTPSLEIH
ncbi:MAG: LPS-assembly protein LptD [Treponema sp.]|nr:LPS-assembly protein LptD [Treponema sp.]